MKNLLKSSNVTITGIILSIGTAKVNNLIGRHSPKIRIFSRNDSKQNGFGLDTQKLNFRVCFNNVYESLAFSEPDNSNTIEQLPVSKTADLISSLSEFMKYRTRDLL